MTTERQIAEIGVGDEGQLYVRPVDAKTHEFLHIYRSESGICWNSTLRALQPVDVRRRDAMALFKQIVTAVRTAYDSVWLITPTTRWVRVPDELRAAIEATHAES